MSRSEHTVCSHIYVHASGLGILRGDVAAGVAGTYGPPFLPSSMVKMYRKQAAFLHASLAGDMGIPHHDML